MKKITLLFIIFLFMGIAGFTQLLDSNWVYQYDRVSLSSDVKITSIINNEYLIMHGLDYYKINGNGDSLNHGNFDSLLDELNDITTHNGALFLGGVLNGDPTLVKLDMSYNTVWSTALFSQSFSAGVSAILPDGNDIYVSGSYQSSTTFIGKLDSLGDTLWTSILPQTTFANLTSIIKLSDGNFLASGNLDDYPLAIKFNSNGDTLWTYTEYLFISFTKMSAFERSNKEIVLVPTRKYIELDSTGQRIGETDFFNDFYDLYEQGDTVYLFGTHKDQQFGGNQYPYIQVINKNLDSLDSYIYTENIHPMVRNRFSDVVPSCSGGFATSGLIRDSINVSANTWNIIAAQFNDTCNSTSGLENNVNNYIISLYPNPTNSQITLNSNEEIVGIVIYNLLGLQVLSRTINTNETQINLKHLPKGMYVVNIIFNERSLSKKLILQ
ncbi:T9SS type A sorting domain-containing protein [Bacteroidota bacterium]